MVLILALWAVGLLTIFALGLGRGVRAKADLLRRLEQRDRLRRIAEAGVAVGRAVLGETFEGRESPPTPAELKAFFYNNPATFGETPIDGGAFRVGGGPGGDASGNGSLPGVIDEERKIPLNRADAEILTRLFEKVLDRTEDEARPLAEAVIDWREYGESEIEGFYSDEYYDNLRYPYPAKKADFETVEELRLVEGVSDAVYDRIFPFVTVYGSGRVNLNTASAEVLYAVGFSDDAAAKIIAVRRGPDGREATPDDVVFQGPGGVMEAVAGRFRLEEEERRAMQEVLGSGRVGTGASQYLIESRARLGRARRVVRCVVDGRSHRVLSWREL